MLSSAHDVRGFQRRDSAFVVFPFGKIAQNERGPRFSRRTRDEDGRGDGLGG